MIYADDLDSAPEQLLPVEPQLRSRKIKSFGDMNWWHWGRKSPLDGRARIYVNNKTRREKPFFVHDSTWFDGSVLALMIRNTQHDPVELCLALNEVNWNELGFVSGGRRIFAQRSLMNAALPSAFKKYLT